VISILKRCFSRWFATRGWKGFWREGFFQLCSRIGGNRENLSRKKIWRANSELDRVKTRNVSTGEIALHQDKLCLLRPVFRHRPMNMSGARTNQLKWIFGRSLNEKAALMRGLSGDDRATIH
jgi:hypothetical protein